MAAVAGVADSASNSIASTNRGTAEGQSSAPPPPPRTLAAQWCACGDAGVCGCAFSRRFLRIGTTTVLRPPFIPEWAPSDEDSLADDYLLPLSERVRRAIVKRLAFKWYSADQLALVPRNTPSTAPRVEDFDRAHVMICHDNENDLVNRLTDSHRPMPPKGTFHLARVYLELPAAELKGTFELDKSYEFCMAWLPVELLARSYEWPPVKYCKMTIDGARYVRCLFSVKVTREGRAPRGGAGATAPATAEELATEAAAEGVPDGAVSPVLDPSGEEPGGKPGRAAGDAAEAQSSAKEGAAKRRAAVVDRRSLTTTTTWIPIISDLFSGWTAVPPKPAPSSSSSSGGGAHAPDAPDEDDGGGDSFGSILAGIVARPPGAKKGAGAKGGKQASGAKKGKAAAAAAAVSAPSAQPAPASSSSTGGPGGAGQGSEPAPTPAQQQLLDVLIRLGCLGPGEEGGAVETPAGSGGAAPVSGFPATAPVVEEKPATTAKPSAAAAARTAAAAAASASLHAADAGAGTPCRVMEHPRGSLAPCGLSGGGSGVIAGSGGASSSSGAAASHPPCDAERRLHRILARPLLPAPLDTASALKFVLSHAAPLCLAAHLSSPNVDNVSSLVRVCIAAVEGARLPGVRVRSFRWRRAVDEVERALVRMVSEGTSTRTGGCSDAARVAAFLAVQGVSGPQLEELGRDLRAVDAGDRAAGHGRWGPGTASLSAAGGRDSAPAPPIVAELRGGLAAWQRRHGVPLVSACAASALLTPGACSIRPPWTRGAGDDDDDDSDLSDGSSDEEDEEEDEDGFDEEAEEEEAEAGRSGGPGSKGGDGHHGGAEEAQAAVAATAAHRVGGGGAAGAAGGSAPSTRQGGRRQPSSSGRSGGREFDGASSISSVSTPPTASGGAFSFPPSSSASAKGSSVTGGAGGGSHPNARYSPRFRPDLPLLAHLMQQAGEARSRMLRSLGEASAFSSAAAAPASPSSAPFTRGGPQIGAGAGAPGTAEEFLTSVARLLCALTPSVQERFPSLLRVPTSATAVAVASAPTAAAAAAAAGRSEELDGGAGGVLDLLPTPVGAAPSTHTGAAGPQKQGGGGGPAASSASGAKRPAAALLVASGDPAGQGLQAPAPEQGATGGKSGSNKRKKKKGDPAARATAAEPASTVPPTAPSAGPAAEGASDGAVGAPAEAAATSTQPPGPCAEGAGAGAATPAAAAAVASTGPALAGEPGAAAADEAPAAPATPSTAASANASTTDAAATAPTEPLADKSAPVPPASSTAPTLLDLPPPPSTAPEGTSKCEFVYNGLVLAESPLWLPWFPVSAEEAADAPGLPMRERIRRAMVRRLCGVPARLEPTASAGAVGEADPGAEAAAGENGAEPSVGSSGGAVEGGASAPSVSPLQKLGHATVGWFGKEHLALIPQGSSSTLPRVTDWDRGSTVFSHVHDDGWIATALQANSGGTGGGQGAAGSGGSGTGSVKPPRNYHAARMYIEWPPPALPPSSAAAFEYSLDKEVAFAFAWLPQELMAGFREPRKSAWAESRFHRMSIDGGKYVRVAFHVKVSLAPAAANNGAAAVVAGGSPALGASAPGASAPLSPLPDAPATPGDAVAPVAAAGPAPISLLTKTSWSPLDAQAAPYVLQGISAAALTAAVTAGSLQSSLLGSLVAPASQNLLTPGTGASGNGPATGEGAGSGGAIASAAGGQAGPPDGATSRAPGVPLTIFGYAPSASTSTPTTVSSTSSGSGTRNHNAVLLALAQYATLTQPPAAAAAAAAAAAPAALLARDSSGGIVAAAADPQPQPPSVPNGSLSMLVRIPSLEWMRRVGVFGATVGTEEEEAEAVPVAPAAAPGAGGVRVSPLQAALKQLGGGGGEHPAMGGPAPHAAAPHPRSVLSDALTLLHSLLTTTSTTATAAGAGATGRPGPTGGALPLLLQDPAPAYRSIAAALSSALPPAGPAPPRHPCPMTLLAALRYVLVYAPASAGAAIASSLRAVLGASGAANDVEQAVASPANCSLPFLGLDAAHQVVRASLMAAEGALLPGVRARSLRFRRAFDEAERALVRLVLEGSPATSGAAGDRRATLFAMACTAGAAALDGAVDPPGNALMAACAKYAGETRARLLRLLDDSAAFNLLPPTAASQVTPADFLRVTAILMVALMPYAAADKVCFFAFCDGELGPGGGAVPWRALPEPGCGHAGGGGGPASGSPMMLGSRGSEGDLDHLASAAGGALGAPGTGSGAPTSRSPLELTDDLDALVAEIEGSGHGGTGGGGGAPHPAALPTVSAAAPTATVPVPGDRRAKGQPASASSAPSGGAGGGSRSGGVGPTGKASAAARAGAAAAAATPAPSASSALAPSAPSPSAPAEAAAATAAAASTTPQKKKKIGGAGTPSPAPKTGTPPVVAASAPATEAEAAAAATATCPPEAPATAAPPTPSSPPTPRIPKTGAQGDATAPLLDAEAESSAAPTAAAVAAAAAAAVASAQGGSSGEFVAVTSKKTAKKAHQLAAAAAAAAAAAPHSTHGAHAPVGSGAQGHGGPDSGARPHAAPQHSQLQQAQHHQQQAQLQQQQLHTQQQQQHSQPHAHGKERPSSDAVAAPPNPSPSPTASSAGSSPPNAGTPSSASKPLGGYAAAASSSPHAPAPQSSPAADPLPAEQQQQQGSAAHPPTDAPLCAACELGAAQLLDAQLSLVMGAAHAEGQRVQREAEQAVASSTALSQQLVQLLVAEKAGREAEAARSASYIAALEGALRGAGMRLPSPPQVQTSSSVAGALLPSLQPLLLPSSGGELGRPALVFRATGAPFIPGGSGGGGVCAVCACEASLTQVARGESSASAAPLFLCGECRDRDSLLQGSFTLALGDDFA